MNGTHELLCDVHEFVLGKRKNREQVTANNVLTFLIDNSHINVKSNLDGSYDSQDFKTALRTIRRFLQRNVFIREAITGTIRVNPKDLAARNEYLRILQNNGNQPPHIRLTEGYTDRSYLHRHHRRDSHSLYHPGDKNEIERKPLHKGKRMCFVAAIEDKGINTKAELIPGSVWIFYPGSKSWHCADYHKVITGENYIDWFKTDLLPDLYEASIIIVNGMHASQNNFPLCSLSKTLVLTPYRTCKLNREGSGKPVSSI